MGGRAGGRRRARRHTVAGAALLAALTGLGSSPALAESPEQARDAAHRAAGEVRDIQRQVEAAMRDYDQAMSGLSRSVSVGLEADREVQAARARLDDRQDAATNQVRAVYMSGGAAALYSSVLDASSTRDLLRRTTYLQRMIATGAGSVEDASAATARSRASAEARDAAIDAHVVTAADVMTRQVALEDALARQEDVLARLSERAGRLEEAERLAAELRAARIAATRLATEQATSARATGVPASYMRLYRTAAPTCPGLSWTVLASIGQVESGHGQNTGPSSAGALGPMQFMPATFAQYGVDGGGDGVTDINDPADSVFSAAHYLCSNGAGRGGDALYQALWRYNNADWYVQMVLRIAGQLAGDPQRG